MHYRSWVFVALFVLTGVSSAQEAKPAQARPAQADPPTPCDDSSSLDAELGKRKYTRKKCAPQTSEKPDRHKIEGEPTVFPFVF